MNRKCHVSFSRLDCGNSLDYYNVVHFIFRTIPGVGVGVGVRAGVDQEPGVGVGTAPPRLRTPAMRIDEPNTMVSMSLKIYT